MLREPRRQQRHALCCTTRWRTMVRRSSREGCHDELSIWSRIIGLDERHTITPRMTACVPWSLAQEGTSVGTAFSCTSYALDGPWFGSETIRLHTASNRPQSTPTFCDSTTSLQGRLRLDLPISYEGRKWKPQALTGSSFLDHLAGSLGSHPRDGI